MRILLVCLNFAPEPTGVGKYTGELAQWLARHGHEVRVITGPPYYPHWRVPAGYSPWWYRRERLGRVDVLRCPLRVPSRCSLGGRIGLLLSFALSSFLPCLWQGLRWRPDLVVAFEPTVLAAPAALLAARIAGGKACLHVQDFEIEAAFRFRLLPSIRRASALQAAYGWLLRRFDLVTTISHSMLRRLAACGLDRERLSLCPNWVDTTTIRPTDEQGWMRRSLGIADDEVVVLYAGNFGEKQGVATLVELAHRLAGRSEIRMVLCGDGAARATVELRLARLPHAILLPVQPCERLNDLLNLADIHLLPLRASAGDVCFPSKLGGMLASGRPVVALTGPGELAEILHGRGIVVDADDARAALHAVLRLAGDPDLRARLGAAGRAFAEQHLDREPVLGRHEVRLRALIAGAASASAEERTLLPPATMALRPPSRGR